MYCSESARSAFGRSTRCASRRTATIAPTPIIAQRVSRFKRFTLVIDTGKAILGRGLNYTTIQRKICEQLVLGPLHSAEPFQRLHNLLCPLRNLIVAQGALAGLESGSHQNRVLARAHFFAAEDFYRNETAQFADA